MKEKKIRDIIQRMLDTEFIFNKEKTTLRDYLDDLVETKKERINWSSYKKFYLFATCLLLRNQSGTKIINGYEYFKSNLLLEKLMNNYPKKNNSWEEELLFKIVEEAGYTSYKKAAPKILMRAKEIFQKKYNSDFNEYISKAEKNIENHFSEDSFLTIHGVGFKTRDLGISCFSNNYLSVDRHLLNVTYRIGLAKFSNIEYEVWKKECVSGKNYIEVSNFLIEVANIAKITPYYLDRLFWTYGKWI